MAKRKFGERIKSFFAGANYMPALDMSEPISFGANSIEEYKEKREQVLANAGWVYLANDTISASCGAIKFKLLHKNADGTEEEVFQHEILDLLNDPHSAWSSMQFWSLYQQYLNLTGEVYLLRIGKDGKPQEDDSKLPASLLILPSQQCQFHLGEQFWEQSTVLYNGHEYSIKSIIRDIVPNPNDPYNGMSVVSKAHLAIDTDMQMRLWNNKLFKNGARPGMVVEVPEKLSDEGFKRLKEQLDASYRGADKAFNKIVLEGGAKVSPFMMSTQDLDFLASKRFTRDEILAMFKVSPSNVGIVENVNRANAEVQENELAKRCILPRMRQLAFVINKRIIKPVYGNEFEVTFENPIIDDRDLQLREVSAGVNKWLTIDEAREAYGYEPLPNEQGSQLYMPIAQAPISYVANGDTLAMPAPEQEPDQQEDSTSEEPDQQEDQDTEEDVNEGTRAFETRKKAEQKRNEEGERKVKIYTRKALAYERRMQKVARRHFDKQQAQALQWLRQTPIIRLDVNKKEWHDGMVDWETSNAEFTQDMERIIETIITEIGSEAYHKLVDGTFDPQTPAIEDYWHNSSLRAVKGINEETKKQLQATLAQGMRANETLDELEARIRQTFGQAGSVRAKTIARTETMSAMNFADETAWEQTGVVRQAEWYTAQDERTVCGFCASLDGKRVPLGEKFFKEGDFTTYEDAHGHEHVMKLDYKDIQTPPLHPNCRCVLRAILDDYEDFGV